MMSRLKVASYHHTLPLEQERRLMTTMRCSESAAQNQNDAIQEFIRGTIAESAPVVPISAQLKYNVDAVCEYIVKRIPVPVRDFTSPPQMIVIRSFDVNKPGSEVEELRGGVAGGSILQVNTGHFSCGGLFLICLHTNSLITCIRAVCPQYQGKLGACSHKKQAEHIKRP